MTTFAPKTEVEPRQWFVLRPTYSRAVKASIALTQQGLEVYMPVIKVRQVVRHGFSRPEIAYVEEPLLKNLIFVHTTYQQIRDLLVNKKIEFLTPYYDHLHYNEFGRNDYLTVDDKSMENFRRVVDTRNKDIIMANPENRKFQTGQLVRVTDGEFAGVIGRVARHKCQQRVFVQLQGICMVATAYVPSAFLQPIVE